jgi:hypothetical protein
MKKEFDPNQESFYTGFAFPVPLSTFLTSFCYTEHKLPMFAKKISQEKQGKKKRCKTDCDHIHKCTLCKLGEEKAHLTSTRVLEEPWPGLIAIHCETTLRPNIPVRGNPWACLITIC